VEETVADRTGKGGGRGGGEALPRMQASLYHHGPLARRQAADAQQLSGDRNAITDDDH
jgi:hypothetical protein